MPREAVKLILKLLQCFGTSVKVTVEANYIRNFSLRFYVFVNNTHREKLGVFLGGGGGEGGGRSSFTNIHEL